MALDSTEALPVLLGMLGIPTVTLFEDEIIQL